MTTLILLLKGMLLNEGSAKEFAKELAVSSMIHEGSAPFLCPKPSTREVGGGRGSLRLALGRGLGAKAGG